MKKFFIVVLLLGILTPLRSQKLVFCYWRTPENVNPSLCTHMLYAFTSARIDGTLGSMELMDTFKAYRDDYPNIKYILSIAASGANSNFRNVSDSESLRQVFAESVLSSLQENNLDGVDIDWEYPENQEANFVLLLKALHDLLHPQGYLVTIAAGAAIDRALTRYDFEGVDKYTDYINLMTYHYHGRWENRTGIGAPLYSSTATIYTVHKTVQFWLSKISNPEKFLLGIPLYGPLWTLTSSNNGTGAPALPSTIYPRYFEICQNVLFNGWTRVWDDVQKAPIAIGGEGEFGEWTGYEDLQSLQEKINYLNENNLGGILFWDMSMDDGNNACGDGAFPMMTLARNAMLGEPPTSTLSTSTIFVPSSTTETPTTTPSSALRVNVFSTKLMQLIVFFFFFFILKK